MVLLDLQNRNYARMELSRLRKKRLAPCAFATIALDMQDAPHAKKSLGQHWLTDPSTLHAISGAIYISPSDTVLEVGPGFGTLTHVLAGQAKRVIAVEFDESLAAKLKDAIPPNVQVINQDILKFDLTSLPPDYKVVANIPYYLTSNLIRNLSESTNPPSGAVLLIQKEVAERVAARPGAMSLLSVAAQFYWETSTGIVVPARMFTPPPKVDSQVLILKRHAVPLYPDVRSRDFFRLVSAGFNNRRKTLLNSLSGGLQKDKATTKAMLERAGISPSARPQELSLDEWYALYKQVDDFHS
jgi:16S rRNA (adenine1518-N6/adenine1519-N6)-dimethyltransferase